MCIHDPRFNNRIIKLQSTLGTEKPSNHELQSASMTVSLNCKAPLLLRNIRTHKLQSPRTCDFRKRRTSLTAADVRVDIVFNSKNRELRLLLWNSVKVQALVAVGGIGELTEGVTVSGYPCHQREPLHRRISIMSEGKLLEFENALQSRKELSHHQKIRREKRQITRKSVTLFCKAIDRYIIRFSSRSRSQSFRNYRAEPRHDEIPQSKQRPVIQKPSCRATAQ